VADSDDEQTPVGRAAAGRRPDRAECGVPAGPATAAPEPSGWLLIRAAGGDRTAWDRLVRRLSPMLWGIAREYGLPAADAAGVVQIAWLRLAERLTQVRDPDRVASWLAVTCRRESATLVRRRRPHEVAADIEPAEDAAADPAAGVAGSDRQQVLLAAVSRLPAQEEVLLRALLSSPQPSYRQVSAAVGMPVGSIGPTRRRALARLRQEVVRAGTGPGRGAGAGPDADAGQPRSRAAHG